MKKIGLCILSVMLIITLSGCRNESETKKEYDVTVYGSIFSGSTEGISLKMSFDPKWISRDSNTKYNRELAQFAALLSQDSYFRSKDLAKNRANRVIFDSVGEEGYDNTYFLKQLGYQDVEYIDTTAFEYDTDKKDIAIFDIGYNNIDNKYDSFIIAFRGCFSADEWYSIYDCGNAEEKCHPDWQNKENNKGSDVAASRALKVINEYIAAHDDANRKNTVLICGHSRGGGIAQIVGAYFEDNKDFRSYCYCFNSAKVSNNSEVEKYKTIFNIYDANDYFSDYLPFADEKLYHYGREIKTDVFNNPDILNEINSLHATGSYVSMNESELNTFKEQFSALFFNRKALYEQNMVTENIADQDSKQMIDYYQSMIDSLELNNQCWVTIDNDELVLTYTDAALLLGLGRILSYGQSQLDVMKELLSNELDYLHFCDSIMETYSKISGAHLLLNSYIISKFNEK